MQVAERSVASRSDRVAELKRQLDVADADIALVNRRLDGSQGRWFLHGHPVRELIPTPYNTYALMQMAPLLWRTFGQSLLEPRSKPEKARRLP